MSASSLRNAAVVLGVGESDIGQVQGMTGLGLNAQAARRAIEDAGLHPSDIDGLLTAYSFTEPYFMLGSVMAEYLGLRPAMCASMIAGGASPGVMIGHAAAAIATGRCRAVLICCGENRVTGMGRDNTVAALTAVGHPWYEAPYGAFIPALYALIAKRHMHEFGTTKEQMAAVAVQSRLHASMHPRAHKRSLITVEDVLGAKPISDPLGLLDCCLISDAAGAIILVSPELARESQQAGAWLYGIGEQHTHEHLVAAPSLTKFGAVESGQRAYEMAGLDPDEIDIAALYDCFTIVPIIEAEELGFCPPGRGGAAFAAGEFSLSGRIPVNTHGGMLSHAHAGAAGGLLGVVEMTRQLRGECGDRQAGSPDIALVHNEGGILSSHCTMIFGRQPR